MNSNKMLRVEYAILILLLTLSAQTSHFVPRHVIVGKNLKNKIVKDSSYLPRGINDLSGIFLALVLDDLAKGILNRRIVALHKMAVDELDSERRFPCICELQLGVRAWFKQCASVATVLTD